MYLANDHADRPGPWATCLWCVKLSFCIYCCRCLTGRGLFFLGGGILNSGGVCTFIYACFSTYIFLYIFVWAIIFFRRGAYSEVFWLLWEPLFRRRYSGIVLFVGRGFFYSGPLTLMYDFKKDFFFSITSCTGSGSCNLGDKHWDAVLLEKNNCTAKAVFFSTKRRRTSMRNRSSIKSQYVTDYFWSAGSGSIFPYIKCPLVTDRQRNIGVRDVVLAWRKHPWDDLAYIGLVMEPYLGRGELGHS